LPYKLADEGVGERSGLARVATRRMKNNLSTSGSSALCAFIVEDNDHMRALLRSLLQAMGVRHFFESRDGTGALKDLSARKPDFIITDLSMAPMDGIEFTRTLRRLPGNNDCVTPIIMVTGHTERRRIEAARDAGVNEILAKPVTAAGLFSRVDEIVHRPRPFVRSPNYIGPCRRRRNDPEFVGPWRRKTDTEGGDTVAVDAGQGKPPA
jgi:CheY-like chemotaxis protein